MPHNESPSNLTTYDKITQNVVESITDAEIRTLAESPLDKRAYVGFEPSGVLHLGHMLTANKLIDLQEVGMKIVVLLADLHAYLNGKGSLEEIQHTAEIMQKQFIAYGLDEDQTEFVHGSDFQLEKEYILDLHKLGTLVTLNRANRAMAEIQSGDVPKVSQAVYPIMQTLDMHYLDLDLAVWGTDQRKVHVLARELLPELGYSTCPMIHTPILSNLTTGIGKMSSSVGTTISMEDSPESIHKKINKAFCPPTATPPEDQDGNNPENPVLQIFQFHIFPRFEQITVERKDKHGGTITYNSYADLEHDLESGNLHPQDAKKTLAHYLDTLIHSGRKELTDQS